MTAWAAAVNISANYGAYPWSGVKNGYCWLVSTLIVLKSASWICGRITGRVNGGASFPSAVLRSVSWRWQVQSTTAWVGAGLTERCGEYQQFVATWLLLFGRFCCCSSWMWLAAWKLRFCGREWHIRSVRTTLRQSCKSVCSKALVNLDMTVPARLGWRVVEASGRLVCYLNWLVEVAGTTDWCVGLAKVTRYAKCLVGVKVIVLAVLVTRQAGKSWPFIFILFTVRGLASLVSRLLKSNKLSLISAVSCLTEFPIQLLVRRKVLYFPFLGCGKT